MGTVVQAKIDWLTLTKKDRFNGRTEVENSIQAFGVAREIFDHFGIEGGRLLPIRSEGFYPWVYGLEGSQATIGVSADLLKQGVRLILPGQAHSSYGKTQGWVEIARDTGWSFTRIDVACDITGKVVDYEQLERVVKGFYPRKKRAVTHHRGVRGDTVYIGSGASDNYCRFYDKGAQQDSPKPWCRAELQIRGDTAKALGRTSGDLVRAAMRHFAAWLGDIPHYAPNCVITWVMDDPERIVPIRETKTDRAIWFDGVVLKAFMNWYADEPEAARSWHSKVETLIYIVDQM